MKENQKILTQNQARVFEKKRFEKTPSLDDEIQL